MTRGIVIPSISPRLAVDVVEESPLTVNTELITVKSGMLLMLDSILLENEAKS